MATRFEKYVRECVEKLAEKKRASLKADVDSAEKKFDVLLAKYRKMLEEGMDAVVKEVEAQMKKDGLTLRAKKDGYDGCNIVDIRAGNIKQRCVETCTTYEYPGYVHDERSPIYKAEAALKDFDEMIDSEVTKLVVYKQDLGWKPEKFEAYLKDLAKKFQ